MEDLETRVKQFNAMRLPGQSMQMHMGTSYLINDLWAEIQRQQVFISAFDGWCTDSTEGIGGPKFDAMLASREALLRAQEKGE